MGKNMESDPLLNEKPKFYEYQRMEHQLFKKNEEYEPFKSSLSDYHVKGMSVSWQNITVFAKPQKKCRILFKPSTEEKPRCILKDVSGTVKPGELLAIMGASGSGKTTLMNVMTNRNLRRLEVSGKVKVNGQVIGDDMAKHWAYVQQEDFNIGLLTVKEYLIFQAMLRMDKHLSYSEKLMEVENAIVELGLTECANVIIGSIRTGKGISGGERKRLAFASEILTNPQIIFCDEPTSGLDSFMCMGIISVLKKLSQSGRTVILTIHQPSSEVYDLFDNILLLAEGRVAYMGNKEGAIALFNKVNLYIPSNYNPADFFTFNLGILPENEKVCKEKVNRICDLFHLCRKFQEDSEDKKSKENSEIESAPYRGRDEVSWITQIKTLLWRDWIELRRNNIYFLTRIVKFGLVASMISIFFYDQQLDQNGITNINGAMLLTLMQSSFNGYFPVMMIFSEQMPFFFWEHGNGIYRTTAYFLSKSIIDLPVLIIGPFLCTLLGYWMIGLRPELSAFGLHTLVVILATNASASCAYFISCICSSTAWTITVASPFVLPLLIFCGYFLNSASIPVYFMWIKYLSWFYYANEALSIIQWSPIKNITCNQDIESCIYSGQEVLRKLNFEESNLYPDIQKIVILVIFYRVLAFICLFIRASRKT